MAARDDILLNELTALGVAPFKFEGITSAQIVEAAARCVNVATGSNLVEKLSGGVAQRHRCVLLSNRSESRWMTEIH